MSTLDLSLVPVPDAIKPLSVEQVIARMKSDFLRDNPEFASAIELESDPVVALINQFAYRESLIRAECNEMVRSMTLAHARGVNLDALASNYNVTRLLIRAADLVAKTTAVYESDDALRERCLLAFASMSTAGSAAAYRYYALSADPDVVDVKARSPESGKVDVIVMSIDGEASSESLSAVRSALSGEENIPLDDEVTVLSVEAEVYSVAAVVKHGYGLNTAAHRAAFIEQIRSLSKIGVSVPISELYAQLHTANVTKVDLLEPAADIAVDDYHFARADTIEIEYELVA